MSKLNFQLVTPERTVLQEELDSLSCPTTLGQITILPHHIPLVATLAPGELVAKVNNQEHFIHVSGGFVEVRENNEIIVLADAAEHHYEIDVKATEEAIERAKKAMSEKHANEADYAKVAATLERNLSRLNVARKHAHRKNPLAGSATMEK